MAQFQCSEKMYNFILDIINPNMEIDIDEIRETVFVAEDTDFTVEQSAVVWPWLLNFAKEYRDTDEPEDGIAVLSAIRTGASMISLDKIDQLFPLLEVNHNVYTVLETIKMIGRIFEAQPPNGVDEYKNISRRMHQTIRYFVNQPADNVSMRDEAVTQLAIYALAGSGSSTTQEIITEVLKKKQIWFIRQVLHNFRELRSTWENRSDHEPIEPLKLLNEAIYPMAEYIKESK